MKLQPVPNRCFSRPFRTCFCASWSLIQTHKVPSGIRQRHTSIQCTCDATPSASVSDNSDRCWRATQFPKPKKCQDVAVRVEWRVTQINFTQENTVCILLLYFLGYSHIGFVLRANHTSHLNAPRQPFTQPNHKIFISKDANRETKCRGHRCHRAYCLSDAAADAKGCITCLDMMHRESTSKIISKFSHSPSFVVHSIPTFWGFGL